MMKNFKLMAITLFILCFLNNSFAFAAEKVLFESNFSDLKTKWEVWDDPQAENKPSQWRLGLAELSGIYNDEGKIATALLAGDISWKNYTIETSVLIVGDSPYLTGFVFSLQNPEHFYAVGLNLRERRFELEVKTPEGFETLETHKIDIPYNEEILFRLDFAGKRIRFSSNNQIILDIEDGRYEAGQFGVCTSNQGNAQILIGPITVTSLDPGSLPEKDITSEDAVKEIDPGEPGKLLFKEDFSSGNLDQWEIWDDPKGYPNKSQWTIVLSDLSNISNELNNSATRLLAGNKAWKNYSLQTNLFCASADGYLTGLVFGYQDPEHFYHAGYNFSCYRYELEVRTPIGFELLAFAEAKFPRGKWIPLRVDFMENRIILSADNRIIFDIEDKRFSTGRIGIDSCGTGDGDILFNNYKVVPFDPKTSPKKQFQNLLSSKRGAAVMYREYPPKSDAFEELMDHSLLEKDDFGDTYDLDLREAELPEEAVFCFPQGRFVEIHRIGFMLAEYNFPKEIKFWVSDQTPKSGFKHLTTITLKPERESYQEFKIPPTTAKYLKMQINQGYHHELITIPEMFVKGYFKELGIRQGGSETLGKVQLKEKEPNDSLSEAQILPLNTYLGGKAAQKDIDYYKLSLKDHPSGTLTLYLNNIGILRPDYTLSTKEGNKIDPSEVISVGSIMKITYHLKLDDYCLQIVRPETYLTIVYDDSSSMGESVPTVKRVLKGYLDNLGEGLSLKLMKYSDEAVELSDFTHDPLKLRQAIDKEVGGGGGTDTFLGLMSAIESVQKKEGNRAVLALFDVLNGGGLEEYIKLWNSLLDGGISFSTIGVQDGWDEKTGFFGNTRKQIFCELAYATRGQFFHSPSDEQVEQSANTIFEQLTAPVEYRLKAEWKEEVKKPGFIQILFEKGVEKEVTKNVELILDASNSMWGQIKGESKILIARKVLKQIINGLPDEMNVGLRVYGHRYSLKHMKACQDTELMVSIGPVAKNQLIETINKIQPKGKTPLVFSALQAVKDFEKINKGSIILITDGIESCNGDINSIAPALNGLGIDLKVHIVGFDIKEVEARKQLEVIAKSTDGVYLDAKDSQELLSSLEQTLQIEYAILDEKGDIKAKGFVGGKPVNVIEGTYTLRLMLETEPLETSITVNPEEKSVLLLKKEKDKWVIKEKK